MDTLKNQVTIRTRFGAAAERIGFRTACVVLATAAVWIAVILHVPPPKLPSGGLAARNAGDSPAGGARIRQEALNAWENLPATFITNQGQLDSRVRYYSQGPGYGIYLTDEEVRLSLVRGSPRAPGPRSDRLRTMTASSGAPAAEQLVLGLQFIGASPGVVLQGHGRAAGAVNHFIGNEPARWRAGLPTYRTIVYRDLWPGIDMRLRAQKDRLKYEFIVRPGARPDDIRLGYAGADGLSLDANGNLLVHTPLGLLEDARPTAYQMFGNERAPLESRYVLIGRRGAGEYGFAVPAVYDQTRPLVIDPGLGYSTFLGGADQDAALAVAVDESGNAYVAGATTSPDFPTTPGAFDRIEDGFTDVVVTKFNAAGSAVVYSTFLGGTQAEVARGLAIDQAGNAYVAGLTTSRDFPTTPRAFDQTFNSQAGFGGDGFITKLDASGSALVYSSYLGGLTFDEVSAIALDGQGNAYLTGQTDSSDFPTTPGAFDPIACETFDCRDVFVTKFNAAGSALVYSTFLKGENSELARGVAVDGIGNAYVTGNTNSSDFPTTRGAFDTTINGTPPFVVDGFVTKLNADGSALAYSTFLGGDELDVARDIAVDPTGNAHVMGSTNSPDFPTTPGAFDTSLNGVNDDVFVTKLNTGGSSLLYSTFLGGQLPEPEFGVSVEIGGIELDTQGNAYITGATHSSDFPTTAGAFDRTYNNASCEFCSDAFLTKLDPSGSALLYSTYLGGTDEEAGWDLALDRSGAAYVTGQTFSSDFPVTAGAFDETFDGDPSNFAGDAFVTKLILPSAARCGGLAPTLSGTRENDVLIGTSRSDVIDGQGGNDRIEGRGGDDVLCGGPSFDLLFGGGGNDRLYGRAGNDALDGGPGQDFLQGDNGEDLLEGGDGEDELWGGDGNDRLLGLPGNDLLEGGPGADRLEGGAGADRLEGRSGTDQLFGGQGDDRLDGGDAFDRCDGGPHVTGDSAASCENVSGIP